MLACRRTTAAMVMGESPPWAEFWHEARCEFNSLADPGLAVRGMWSAACGVLAAIITCVSSGCGAEAPKGPQVNEPADVLAAIKQCGAEPEFDDEGRVRQLRVSRPSPAANPTLPFLRRLDHLRDLYVVETRGNSAWAASVAGLTQLESLSTIHGGMNDVGLKYLANLKRLRKLVIEFDDVTDAGLEHLRPLENLEELWIRGVPITDAGLPSLARLPRLKWLTLQETRITPEGMLALRDTRLEDFRWCDDYRRGDYREQREMLPYIKHFKNLRVLHLDCQAVTDDDLRHVGEIVSLEVLNLSQNQITDAGLSHLRNLKNLRTLNLSHNRLDGQVRLGDAGLAHLTGLVKLRHLELTALRVTTAGLDALRDLQNLEFLEITETPLRNAGIIDLRRFRRLRTVSAYDFDETKFRLPDGCDVVTFD